MPSPIRIATRAIIIKDDRLLLVNAWRDNSDLWCAPGGGADPHHSLPDNLAREVYEETGLTVSVGESCLVNEFHDPACDFHQVDIYFRCEILKGETNARWEDPDGVVNRHIWASRAEMAKLRFKPDSLVSVAWNDEDRPSYDPLEPLIR